MKSLQISIKSVDVELGMGTLQWVVLLLASHGSDDLSFSLTFVAKKEFFSHEVHVKVRIWCRLGLMLGIKLW